MVFLLQIYLQLLAEGQVAENIFELLIHLLKFMKIVNELQAKFLLNSTHGDSHNLTLSKVNACYGLVDAIVLPKLFQGCS